MQSIVQVPMARPKITDFSINAIMGNTLGPQLASPFTTHTNTPTPPAAAAPAPVIKQEQVFSSQHVEDIAIDLSCVSLRNSKTRHSTTSPNTISPNTISSDNSSSSNSSSGGISNHNNSQAIITSKKPRPKKYQCPYCWVALSNTGQYRGHIRIHTGERPFKCDQANCEKTFTRNEELTRHKRIHTGQRPFACRLCNKRFGRKDHLKKHTRTHERHARMSAMSETPSSDTQSPPAYEHPHPHPHPHPHSHHLQSHHQQPHYHHSIQLNAYQSPPPPPLAQTTNHPLQLHFEQQPQMDQQSVVASHLSNQSPPQLTPDQLDLIYQLGYQQGNALQQLQNTGLCGLRIA